jgi:hypothetical protein
MCTYLTSTVATAGSATSAGGEWFRLQRGVVYFDHPQDAPIDHALCIDFRGEALDRVAVELDAASARALATSILEMLDSPEVRDLAG